MFTGNTLIVVNIVLCVLIIAFIFFCLYGILSIKEKFDMHIKQNQANQQKLLNRIDEYRIRIDNLETLIEKNQNKKAQDEPIVIDDQKQI